MKSSFIFVVLFCHCAQGQLGVDIAGSAFGATCDANRKEELFKKDVGCYGAIDGSIIGGNARDVWSFYGHAQGAFFTIFLNDTYQILYLRLMQPYWPSEKNMQTIDVTVDNGLTSTFNLTRNLGYYWEPFEVNFTASVVNITVTEAYQDGRVTTGFVEVELYRERPAVTTEIPITDVTTDFPTDVVTTDFPTDDVTTDFPTDDVTTDFSTMDLSADITSKHVTTNTPKSTSVMTTDSFTTEGPSTVMTTDSFTTEGSSTVMTTDSFTTEGPSTAMTTDSFITEGSSTVMTTDIFTTEGSSNVMSTDSFTTGPSTVMTTDHFTVEGPSTVMTIDSFTTEGPSTVMTTESASTVMTTGSSTVVLTTNSVTTKGSSNEVTTDSSSNAIATKGSNTIVTESSKTIVTSEGSHNHITTDSHASMSTTNSQSTDAPTDSATKISTAVNPGTDSTADGSTPVMATDGTVSASSDHSTLLTSYNPTAILLSSTTSDNTVTVTKEESSKKSTADTSQTDVTIATSSNKAAGTTGLFSSSKGAQDVSSTKTSSQEVTGLTTSSQDITSTSSGSVITPDAGASTDNSEPTWLWIIVVVVVIILILQIIIILVIIYLFKKYNKKNVQVGPANFDQQPEVSQRQDFSKTEAVFLAVDDSTAARGNGKWDAKDLYRHRKLYTPRTPKTPMTSRSEIYADTTSPDAQVTTRSPTPNPLDLSRSYRVFEAEEGTPTSITATGNNLNSSTPRPRPRGRHTTGVDAGYHPTNQTISIRRPGSVERSAELPIYTAQRDKTLMNSMLARSQVATPNTSFSGGSLGVFMSPLDLRKSASVANSDILTAEGSVPSDPSIILQLQPSQGEELEDTFDSASDSETSKRESTGSSDFRVERSDVNPILRR